MQNDSNKRDRGAENYLNGKSEWQIALWRRLLRYGGTFGGNENKLLQEGNTPCDGPSALFIADGTHTKDNQIELD